MLMSDPCTACATPVRSTSSRASGLARGRPMMGVPLRVELPVDVFERDRAEPVLRAFAKLLEQDPALDIERLGIVRVERTRHPLRFHAEHRGKMAARGDR